MVRELEVWLFAERVGTLALSQKADSGLGKVDADHRA